MLTIGSLFSGIGGLELGLEWSGLGPVLWQVEREPFARQVLEKHWPNVKRYSDVCTVGAHNLIEVDLVCGGFPCQDISFAGSGAGLAGARSGLWREYHRIVGEIRPRFIVVENVSALRSRGLGQVLGDLATLRYDAWWDCIPACAVGAPHRRDRLFIVAYRHGERCARPRAWEESERGAEPANGGAGPREDRPAESGLGRAVDGLPRWLDRGWPTGPGEAQHPWEAPRTAQGVPQRPARLKALGNAVVPDVGYVIGRIVQIIAHQQGT